MKKIDEKNKIFNLNIFGSKKSELLKILKNQLEQGSRPLIIFTPNPEQVVLAKHNPEFAKVLGAGDLLIPDGIGLILASKIVSFFSKPIHITERITGLEVARFLLQHLNHDRILIVGGREYDRFTNHNYTVHKVTQQYLSSVSSQASGVVCWLPAYENIATPTEAEETFVQQTIATLQPTVVLVALGAPHQELWIQSHKQSLATAGVKVGMVVGGAFDVIFGKLKSAPQLWQSLGLEWLYRLIQEPWRWKRQLRLIQFVQLIFEEVGKHGND